MTSGSGKSGGGNRKTYFYKSKFSYFIFDFAAFSHSSYSLFLIVLYNLEMSKIFSFKSLLKSLKMLD